MEWHGTAYSGQRPRQAGVQNSHLPAIRLTASVAIPQVQQSEGRTVFSLEVRKGQAFAAARPFGHDRGGTGTFSARPNSTEVLP
jgi:hypothetical protein